MEKGAYLISDYLLLTLPILPLLSFILISLLSGKSEKFISATASLILSAGLVTSIILFFEVLQSGPLHLQKVWFSGNSFAFHFNIYFDNLSAVISLLVMLISTLVHIYSGYYMHNEAAIERYFATLSFFTFAMLGVVMAGNLLLIFISWELVGLASYLLIGFWRDKPEAAQAASKAFIMNRIGDAGFIAALMIIWVQTGTFDLVILQNAELESTWRTITGLCLLAGVIGKSAQFPLLTWLPDAMEGPTPVSALIHAATMVAAGIFLLARVFFVLDDFALHIILVTGLVTSLMGALSALYQNDIKKVLAYSTISQLGLMVVAIGLGNFGIAILHLFVHGFFKASLFLAAGNIIQSNKKAFKIAGIDADPQDIWTMGGLRKRMPVTYIAFIISSASLSGLVFFSGFLSKEALFNLAVVQQAHVASAFLYTVSFITALYCTKLCLVVFFGENRTAADRPGFIENIKEAPLQMLIPVLVLSVCSLWWVVGLNPFSFNQWLIDVLRTEQIETQRLIGILTPLWVFAAFITGLRRYSNTRRPILKYQLFFTNSFYLNSLYQKLITKPLLAFSNTTGLLDKKVIDKSLHFTAYAQVAFAEIVGWFDRSIIDGTVNLTAFISKKTGEIIKSAGGGKIQSYIAWAVIVIVIFMLWVILKRL